MAVESWPNLVVSRVSLRINNYVLVAVLVFILALLPRVLATGHFWTRDEPFHWVQRSETFLQAYQQGDYARTNLTGHPGVTTMWLGAAGWLLHQNLAQWGWIDPADLTMQRALLRLPLAIVTSLSIALAYLLLRRLFGQRVALLATLFWLADPFLVAHSQVLHLDALLAACMTLALLTAMVAFRFDDPPCLHIHGAVERNARRAAFRQSQDAPRELIDVGKTNTFPNVDVDLDRSPDNHSPLRVRWSLLFLSALAGGLALLTRSTAILLLPMIGLIGLLGLRHQCGVLLHWQNRHALKTLLFALLFWVAVVPCVWFAVWPAMRVDPAAALNGVIDEVHGNAGVAHETGNFFLGRPVDDPGPLFYPVALALRLTPWALIGLFVAAGVVLTRRKRVTPGMLVLAIFATLFIVAVSLLSKKMDRYILPIFPTLNSIAAWGWVALLESVWPTWQQRYPLLRRPGAVLWWIVLAVALGANLAWYHPYELAYYNPLLGGGPVAARSMLVGWGEGLDQVADFLNSETNDCEQFVAAWYWPLLQDEVCMRLAPLDQAIKSVDVRYAVTYINQLQRQSEPQTMAVLSNMTPVHTVRLHGIDYAAIYQLPYALEQLVEVDFGPGVQLRDYSLHTDAIRSSGTFTLTLQWQALAPLEKDYLLFIHMLDAGGNLIAQVDVPPGGATAPTYAWQPHRYIAWTHTIPVPADTPPGSYQLTLGLYDPETFSRLPFHTDTPALIAANDGDHALLLGEITLR